MKARTVIRIRLDAVLQEQEITRYEVSKRTGIKYQTIDNYYKNRVIRYDSEILLKLCNALDCTIQEIIEVK